MTECCCKKLPDKFFNEIDPYLKGIASIRTAAILRSMFNEKKEYKYTTLENEILEMFEKRIKEIKDKYERKCDYDRICKSDT